MTIGVDAADVAVDAAYAVAVVDHSLRLCQNRFQRRILIERTND